MNTYIVWIEMDKATTFKVIPDGPQIRTLRRREIRHHTSRDPENHKNCDKFFKKVAASLDDADEILLIGPSLTKDHFRTYLDKHDPILGRCIVGMLSEDIQSDARLMARSREFFREYDIFGQVVVS